MKFIYLAAIASCAPSLASAWICTCLNASIPSRPQSAAGGLCKDLKGLECHDKNTNDIACITGTRWTDKQCADRYFKLVNGQRVPDPTWTAFCQSGTSC
ncbi:hypothetical protein EsH8_II_001460 [Colletotrichum jinshuiense]